MSLQSVINKKDAFTQNLLTNFGKQWEKMSPEIQKGLTRLFRSGDFGTDAINKVFTDNGFDVLAEATTKRFNEMFNLSRELSQELGYNFLITPENKGLFLEASKLNFDTLTNTGRANALDLRRFAIEGRIEGRSIRDITRGFEQIFDNMGRRLNTEVFTGIRNFESAIDFKSMQQGGIEKFQYVGPFDGKERDACRSTLSDPLQSTGWTAEQVRASETPFIERGGWNCRHRWMAFVEGETIVKDNIAFKSGDDVRINNAATVKVKEIRDNSFIGISKDGMEQEYLLTNIIEKK